jgi:hypothetical protein
MINVTLSFPELLIQRIDSDRGDVSRSKFVIRLLEKAYQNSIKEAIGK